MDLVEQTGDRIEAALNAEGRSHQHVALGFLMCAGAIAVTTLIAAARPQPAAPGAPPEGRKSPMRALWPALFSVTTLSAVRLWNAPSTPARTRALSVWGGLQGLNAFWMLVRPRDPATRAVAAVTTAGLTFVYARAAGAVDHKSAGMIAPAGWATIAGLFAARPQPAPRTLH